MGYTVDYTKIYRCSATACGKPSPEILNFVDTYLLKRKNSANPPKVLDLGAGQGRYTVPLAKMGCCVTAVDVCKIGIQQLAKLCERENVSAHLVIGDIVHFFSKTKFEIILAERVLHILDGDYERESVLLKIARYLKVHGRAIITDTPKNMANIKHFLSQNCPQLFLIEQKKNTLYLRKNPAN